MIGKNRSIPLLHINHHVKFSHGQASELADRHVASLRETHHEENALIRLSQVYIEKYHNNITGFTGMLSIQEFLSH